MNDELIHLISMLSLKEGNSIHDVNQLNSITKLRQKARFFF